MVGVRVIADEDPAVSEKILSKLVMTALQR